MIRRAGALATLAVAALVARAEAAPPPRVAVLVGEVLGVADAEAETLSASLASALSAKLVVEAIGGADVARRLPPAGLPEECLSTPACVADLGSRLDADRLLVLVVVRAGDALQIDATMIDVATAVGAPRPRLQLTSLDGADAAFAESATRYLPDAEERAAIGGGGSGSAHRPIRPAVWATGGVGLAAVIGAGVLGLTIKSKYDGCNDVDHPCTESKQSDLHRRALLADVTLGIGVAALATAVVLYLRTPLESTGLEPSLAPTDGGATVGLGGRF